MKQDLLDILCCPVCKGELELVDPERSEDGEIVAGVLRCGDCPFDYPIEDGIPNLLPPDMQQSAE